MSNEIEVKKIQAILDYLSGSLNGRDRSPEGKALWDNEAKCARDPDGRRVNLLKTEALTKRHVYRK